MQIINNDSSLILSSGEIYVLAAMMGYKSVFGVDSGTLSEWSGDMKKYVCDIADRLEKRMLMLIDLGGTVNFESGAEKMIRCMCEPESAVRFTFTGANSRKCESWVMHRNGRILRTDRITQDAYKLSPCISEPESDIISEFFRDASKTNIHERIPFSDITEICGALEAFERDRAAVILEKHLEIKDSEDVLLDVFSGGNAFLRIQGCRRKNDIYRRISDCLIIRSGAAIIKISQKDDTVFVDSVSIGDVCGLCTADA